MDENVLVRIDSLLEHIDLVLSDTKGINIVEFDEDSVLVRATCFSISQIGEQMVNLEKKIGKKYPELPWVYARNMRNIIVHDYEKIDLEQVSSTIVHDLAKLKEDFANIRKDFE